MNLKTPALNHFPFSVKINHPGGGTAIIFNENRYHMEVLNDISADDNIENVWTLCRPKVELSLAGIRVKRIAIGSYYVSTRTKNRQPIIDHIIEAIHMLRAKYDNQISFLIGGDFNRSDYSDILDSYGMLKQVVSVPTRNSARLEIVLTDLHSLYHPVTTLSPLQVDTDKKGKDSDHEIVLFAPKSDRKYVKERKKMIVKTRPLST